MAVAPELSPNDVALVLFHQKSSWILPFDVCPSSCEMKHENTSFEFPFIFVVAGYFFWESVQLPLRNHDELVFHEGRLEQDVAHTVLFGELVLSSCVSAVVIYNAVYKCVRAGACAGEEGTRVEFEAGAKLV